MSRKKIFIFMLLSAILLTVLTPLGEAVQAEDFNYESFEAQAQAGSDTGSEYFVNQMAEDYVEKPTVPDNSIFVIDLSEWQKPELIDYDILSSQIDAVILRIGYTGYGTGETYVKDAAFDRHYQEFKKRNIPIGGYWYSCADTVEEGAAEAKETLKYIEGKEFDLPIYWDTEDVYHQINASRDVLTDTALSYLKTIKDAGRNVGIYSSPNWFNKYLNLSKLQGYEIWIAHWGVNTPGFQGNYWMWQFTGKGRLDGYDNDLDFSFRAKNGPDIITQVVENQDLEGWKKENGQWFYYKSGIAQKGWQKIGTDWYYLGTSGERATGWQKIDGRWYYLNNEGVMQTGWVKIGSTRYYMSSNGVMQTGWLKIGGTRYYMSSSGAMVTGWVKANNTWYYMSSNGAMQTGWVKAGNTWYYMSSSGAMQTGWVKVNNTWYYMTSSGAMQTGWVKVNNTWYYMSSSGAMVTGWVRVNNTWYYMSPHGAMQTGWVKAGNTWYFMSSSGAMQTGWERVAGKWYYLNQNGSMAYNTWIDGYWLGSNGAMQ